MGGWKTMVNNELRTYWSNVYKEREDAKGERDTTRGQQEPCERDQEKSYKREKF